MYILNVDNHIDLICMGEYVWYFLKGRKLFLQIPKSNTCACKILYIIIICLFNYITLYHMLTKPLNKAIIALTKFSLNKHCINLALERQYIFCPCCSLPQQFSIKHIERQRRLRPIFLFRFVYLIIVSFQAGEDNKIHVHNLN